MNNIELQNNIERQLVACKCEDPLVAYSEEFIITAGPTRGNNKLVMAAILTCELCGEIMHVMFWDVINPQKIVNKVYDIHHEMHIVITTREISEPPYIALCGKVITGTIDAPCTICKNCKKILSAIYPMLLE